MSATPLTPEEESQLERAIRVLVSVCKDDPQFRASILEMVRLYELGIELQKEGCRLDEEAVQLDREVEELLAE